MKEESVRCSFLSKFEWISILFIDKKKMLFWLWFFSVTVNDLSLAVFTFFRDLIIDNNLNPKDRRMSFPEENSILSVDVTVQESNLRSFCSHFAWREDPSKSGLCIQKLEECVLNLHDLLESNDNNSHHYFNGWKIIVLGKLHNDFLAQNPKEYRFLAIIADLKAQIIRKHFIPQKVRRLQSSITPSQAYVQFFLIFRYKTHVGINSHRY